MCRASRSLLLCGLIVILVALAGCSSHDGGSPVATETEEAAIGTASVSGFSKIFSYAFAGLCTDLKRSLAGQLPSSGLGTVMTTVASGDTSPVTLQRLGIMNQALARIMHEDQVLADRVDVSLSNISKSRADLNTLNNSAGIDGDLATIRADLQMLLALCNPSQPHTPADATALMQMLLDPGQHDLIGKLTSINAGILGSGGAGGVLRDWTATLLARIDAGEDPEKAYLTLEHYFMELLDIQAEGLILVSDAKKLEALAPAGFNSVGGTAEQYSASTFMPRIERQMHLFLEQAEKLALRKTAPRTGSFLTLPAKAAEIFRRSDWVGAQLCEVFPAPSPKIQYGIHVHVLLEPERVSSSAVPTSITLGTKTLSRVAVNGRASRQHSTENYLEIIPGPTDPTTGYNSRQMSQDVLAVHYQLRLPNTDSTGIQRGSFAWAGCPAKSFAVNVRRHGYDFRATTNVSLSQLMAASIIDYRVLALPMVWHAGDITNSANVGRARQAASPTNPALYSWLRLYGWFNPASSERWAKSYLWTEWRWTGTGSQSIRAKVTGKLEGATAYSFETATAATEALVGSNWAPRAEAAWLAQNGVGSVTGQGTVNFAASATTPRQRLVIWLQSTYAAAAAVQRDYDGKVTVNSVYQEAL